MKIQNNVFIVTGGASGLGASVAQMLVREGGKVVIMDVQQVLGEKHAEALGAHFICGDVASEKEANAAILKATQLGALRGLINCAGVAPAMKTVGKEGPHALDAFERTIRINLIGTFNMSRLAAQAMTQEAPTNEGECGVIINTASVAAFEGQMGQVAYAASKAAIVGLTLPMARDLARHAIRVMTIAPGLFATPMLLNMPLEVQDALGKSVPFPARLGKPEEYAQLVQSIIENSMLNGETIRLDGALRMQPK